MAMSGNGAVTGMVKIIITAEKRKAGFLILQGQQQDRTVYFVAGVGATTPTTVGRLIVIAAFPSAGVTLLASVWFWFRSHCATLIPPLLFDREAVCLRKQEKP